MVGGRCLTGSSLTGALIVQIDFMVVVVDRICCGFAARSRKKNGLPAWSRVALQGLARL